MANQTESYQKVIDIMANQDFDNSVRSILIQICKTNPQIVVNALEFLKSGKNTKGVGVGVGVGATVMNALYAGRKIEAIKQHRYDTGLCLKEAKDAVEFVINTTPNLHDLFHRDS